MMNRFFSWFSYQPTNNQHVIPNTHVVQENVPQDNKKFKKAPQNTYDINLMKNQINQQYEIEKKKLEDLSFLSNLLFLSLLISINVVRKLLSSNTLNIYIKYFLNIFSLI